MSDLKHSKTPPLSVEANFLDESHDRDYITMETMGNEWSETSLIQFSTKFDFRL